MTEMAPSLLAADFSRLKDEIARVAEADYLHLDIMDGHYVPNISFGPGLIKTIRPLTSLTFDTHLMIERPSRYIEKFAAAGSDIITIHQEAAVHLDRVIHMIKDAGCKAGVSLNPATPLQVLEYVIEEIDLILLMSVNPGFGGQSFIPIILEKITKLRRLLDKKNPAVKIEVDGGIYQENVDKVVEAGADIIVAGSAIFGSDDPARALVEMRQAAANAEGVKDER